jgi:hypothetical protein
VVTIGVPVLMVSVDLSVRTCTMLIMINITSVSTAAGTPGSFSVCVSIVAVMVVLWHVSSVAVC